jgi:mono/diheme cytochrome c family protein
MDQVKLSSIMGAASAGVLAVGLGYAVLAATAPSAARASGEAAVVTKVDDFMLADQDYLAYQLHRLKKEKAAVLISYAAGDAAIRRDAPAIMALKKAYADKGVEVWMIDSRAGETRDKVIADARSAGLDLPILFDYEQLVGEQLGVERAGEAIVINPRNWKIAYRGPVSEGAGEAVEALLSGAAYGPVIKQAQGGLIAFPGRAKAPDYAKISYAHTIAPIIQQKCATCHQPGGIGPMPLTSYEQIKGFSPMIREVIRTRRMPPYLADETVGHFMDDDRLTPDQIKTLVHWVEAGSPRGEGADPLAKIKFQAPEWPLGKPDVIVDIPPAEIPATGVMEYQRPVVKNVMTEGRWMKATTFRVSDRQVVHHILSGVVDGDGGATKTASESEWGASLGGYGPGRGSNISPKDLGTWVPPSGGVAFQNHYTPYGKPTVEKTQMGLYFYPKGQEPKYVLRTFGIFDPSIVIPAGEERHHEMAYIAFPHDAMLYGITPHAHHRGASSSTSIRYPDGHEVMLLALPKYDFNWQYEYFLKTPIKIPAGAKVVTRWTYDNSARNPDNPDASRTITWGEQSSEEMLATYLHYRWVDETVKDQKPEYEKQLMSGLMIGMMDDNMDGKLQPSELKGKPGEPLKKYLAIIDTNKDGMIDQAELMAAAKLLPSRRAPQKTADGVVPNGGGGSKPATAAPAAAPAPAPAPVAAATSPAARPAATGTR